MEQPNRFQKLVTEAKKHITEISPDEAEQLAANGEAVLIDVRDESDFREAHARGASISGAASSSWRSRTKFPTQIR